MSATPPPKPAFRVERISEDGHHPRFRFFYRNSEGRRRRFTINLISARDADWLLEKLIATYSPTPKS